MTTREETTTIGVRAAAPTGAATDTAVRSYGIARVFPIFSVTFAVVYFLGVYTGYGPIRYYPLLGQWTLAPLPASPEPGPAMMWYGWIINALVGGTLVAGLSLLLPKESVERLWDRWIWAPVALTLVLVIVLVYLLSGYFTH